MSLPAEAIQHIDILNFKVMLAKCRGAKIWSDACAAGPKILSMRMGFAAA